MTFALRHSYQFIQQLYIISVCLQLGDDALCHPNDVILDTECRVKDGDGTLVRDMEFPQTFMGRYVPVVAAIHPKSI